MIAKQNDHEYALFCDSLENQYEQAENDGVLKILKVLELDEEHSNSDLVQAINYFNRKNGLIEKDAPISFLTELEQRLVYRNGKFRPRLYCMLLSTKFSNGIENKSIFLKHSLKFAFDQR